MNQINWKTLLPHGIAVVFFFALAIAYNSSIIDGGRLVSHDDTMYRGAAKEIIDYREKEHEEGLWTNNMFSGMPAYTLAYAPQNNLVGKVFTIVGSILPTPAIQMFWAMLCFYILLVTFGFKPYASAIGAIAYGFCSFNIEIVTAGHYAKLWALAFFPLIVAGINLTFQKKYIWGALITGVGTSVEIIVNHPQMTYYYFVFFLSLYMIYLFINAIVKKEVKHAFIASAITVVMMVVGLGSNANRLLPINEYTAYSTRGKSDLKQVAASTDQTGGLDKSYIVGYSSGRDDIFSFLVPNFKGFNSGVQLVENPIAKETLGKDKNMVMQTEQMLYNNYGEIISQYWGGTDLAGPGRYCSVIIFALFLLGFVFVKHPVKWLIIPAFLLTMMLSWGKNYMVLTDFFIEHFPMYNKFRAVNSIVIVITFMIPLLASFMLARLANEPAFLEKPSFGKYKNKHILVAGLGGILLLLLAMYAVPTAFQSFTTPSHMVDRVGKYMSEREMITEALSSQNVDQPSINKVIGSIEQGRIAIFKADALRSFIYLLLGSIFIGLYAFKKIPWQIMIAAVGVFVLIDICTYDYRFLNDKNFKPKKESKKDFDPSYADQVILNDSSIHKRVLNLSLSPFNDGTTSYYHQSLGGYSGAKIKRYQELIERGIFPELNRIFGGGTEKVDSLLSTAHVLNMLNTKYFIFDTKAAPLPNRHANGPAWMVTDIRFVEDADAEIESLKTINTKTTAVIDKKFEPLVKKEGIRPDSTATIKMIVKTPRLLEYEFTSTYDQFVVFSEIYYWAGWKAYIDGNEVDIIRVNYVLRALSVPKGKHKIEFMFDPASVRKGETYSLLGSSVMVLLLLAGMFVEFRRMNRKTPPKIKPSAAKK